MLAILLLKPIILLTSATLYTVAITPPQPRVVSNAVYKGQCYEYIVRYISYLAGAMIMIPSVIQSILLLYPNPQPLSTLVPICLTTPLPQAQLARFSPSFLLGLTSILSGAFVRLWSYHVLGTLFTFEVVIKDDHKLITAGPYAYVRHPAYTGMALLTIGAYFMHFGDGGYVAGCGMEGVPAVAVIGWTWRASSLFGFVSLYRRCSVEDAKLKTQFGVSWLRYKESVPYALIPYLV